MDIVPRLRRHVRRHLLRLGLESGDPATALRFHAASRLGLGKTSSEVVKELDLARSTVVRTAHRYAEEGSASLYDKRRSNGQPKVGGAFQRHLARLLRRTPEHFGWTRPTWTRELLRLQMQRDGRPAVAALTIGRALAQIGARLGSPKPIVLCPWPRGSGSASSPSCALKAGATAEQPVLSSDEVDIHRNPRIGRDWMLRG